MVKYGRRGVGIGMLRLGGRGGVGGKGGDLGDGAVEVGVVLEVCRGEGESGKEQFSGGNET